MLCPLKTNYHLTDESKEDERNVYLNDGGQNHLINHSTALFG